MEASSVPRVVAAVEEQLLQRQANILVDVGEGV
jgi:hypothetical protein